jgi:hypothetical protein
MITRKLIIEHQALPAARVHKIHRHRKDGVSRKAKSGKGKRNSSPKSSFVSDGVFA